MKKITLILVAVLVLGIIAIPAFAKGGFGMGGFRAGGMMHTLNDDELARWLHEQVVGGWMTQKQADHILEQRKLKEQLQTEEGYFAYVDQQVLDGWLTERQATALKDNYKLYKEKLGDKAVGRMGGGMINCPAVQGGAGMMKGRMGQRGFRGR